MPSWLERRCRLSSASEHSPSVGHALRAPINVLLLFLALTPALALSETHASQESGVKLDVPLGSKSPRQPVGSPFDRDWYLQHRLPINAALDDGGDLTQFTDEQIGEALGDQIDASGFAARWRRDTSEHEMNISRLKAEQIRRQGGPPVRIATATFRPGPTESFITVEAAREIFKRTGRWPKTNVWDLGRFGRNPNQYLSDLDRPKPPTPPVDPAPAREESSGRRSQFINYHSPGERAYNHPLVPNDDRIIALNSIVSNPDDTIVAVARVDTDHNGAIGSQAAILGRTGAPVRMVGMSRDAQGNPDPVGDIIGLVRNQYSQNGGRPVDVVIAGHGDPGRVTLAPGPNGTLDRSSVPRLNHETHGMIGNFTITGCNVAGGFCPNGPDLLRDINANRVVGFTDPVFSNIHRYDLLGLGEVTVPTVLSTRGWMVEVNNNEWPGLGSGPSFGRGKDYSFWP